MPQVEPGPQITPQFSKKRARNKSKTKLNKQERLINFHIHL